MVDIVFSAELDRIYMILYQLIYRPNMTDIYLILNDRHDVEGEFHHIDIV